MISILLFIVGIYLLVKGKVSLSSKKELVGKSARSLGVVYVLLGIFISLGLSRSIGFSDAYSVIVDIVAVIVITILFGAFGSRDKMPKTQQF